jgi:AAA domain-containing protein
VSALDEAELDDIAEHLPGERPHLSVLPPGPEVDWDGIADGTEPSHARASIVAAFEWADDIEIPDDEAPMALEPFVLNEGPVVLFGQGDTGKSILAQALATIIATGRSDVIVGRTPAVVGPVVWADFEASRRRFARRHQLLGPAPIIYAACALPIWKEEARLRAICEQEGAVALVVDSILPALGASGPNRSSKDAEPAAMYFTAVNAIASRSLSIGHVTKGGDDDTKPYGSAFFHNFARLTWRLRREPGAGHVVTLTNHKFNDGERLAPLGLDIRWGDQLTIAESAPRLTPERLAELVTSVAGDGDASLEAIKAEVKTAGYAAGDSWLRDLLAKAVDAGLVARPRKGRYAGATGVVTGVAPSAEFEP